MSDWITDRLPTVYDASECDEVLVSSVIDGVTALKWNCVKEGEPWMPCPPPYVPPKPKRHRLSEAHIVGVPDKTFVMLEVLPGDPPDLDALLEAIDAPGHDAALPVGYQTWIRRVREARHGEGGE